MNTLLDCLWASFVAAKLTAEKVPTDANALRERERLEAFAMVFLRADEGEAA